MKLKVLIIVLLILAGIVFGEGRDSNTSKRLGAKALRSTETIVIDGRLSETVWQRMDNCFSNFLQRDPVEGAQPTERTEVRIAYDDEALYVGARMYDSHPDSIVARLSRRDNSSSSDIIYFYIDPYLDHRTGNYFGVNAAGTLFDGTLYNDDWSDNSWDGVWEAKSSIDSLGWVAEMRIPYSQLRFHKADSYVWAINVERMIQRKNEDDYITFTPKDGSGFVSRFPEIQGIEHITPPGRVELLPYIIGKAEYLRHDAEDPFIKNSRYTPGLGLDFKMGLGSNLTLNATVNPDFGQVEVDPAVVNLSDVETFYQEKRPFFIEGSSIFNFGRGGAVNYWGFNWPEPNLFYSRRIGRAPQGSLPDNDYSDVPSGAHILGAAKLTGKMSNNWNIGAISALTMRESAEMQYEGKKSTLEVEPLTYYGVYRAQKDFNDGRQGLGFLATQSSRFFKEDWLRSDINSSALALGLDGWTFLDSDKEWVISGYMEGTRVTGTKERITDLQMNSQHYLQRPDRKYIHVDSSATSLSGYAGRFYVVKQKGNFFVNTALGFIDPRFDVNDAGYMSRGDVINMHAGAGYKWTEPNKTFRYLELGGAFFRSYDFDKNIIWEGLFHFGSITFSNYYYANWNLAYNPRTISNRRTRGGPLTLNESGSQVNFYWHSDDRKGLVIGNGYDYYGSRDGSNQWDTYWEIQWRPGANFSISITPEFSGLVENTQWVDSYEDAAARATYGTRYIFAKMEQLTAAAGIRVNWIFTPQLSLQLYMQPLISSGDYTDFKMLSRPGSMDYDNYGKGNSTIVKDGDEYTVDADGAANPAEAYTFDNPSFNYKSLRGNAVLRWEYMPGSILYLVWTQNRDESDTDGQFKFGRSLNRLVNTRADNIFMMKFTYWFNM
ncbi:MAG: carbohydrate binding family 9 domain-containing protein [Ignavibacteria bacterium]|jgi:hypothetical protein|nr:carbohydrate binding family 9 domain-containing protein [Ignavibacteria bacterium]MCU7504391.1 carbohydrate binding family 9 domain-containing protein [Ignavibacteria bacterium]MCU7518168.1 carbohydrate binding family 9 domain-containing protein [Ignavibacteria bacterium]